MAVAVIGAGGWGQNLVRNLSASKDASLRWVCDLSSRARADASAAYPEARCSESYRGALDDAAVEAVVVATEAASHHPIARDALLAGKDVFVEKPLALSSAHARDLCELAERDRRILMVGHVLLYHPAVAALRQLIDAGDLGDVMYLYAQRLNLGVVRRDENAWWSLAPHDVALANHLLGDIPEAVSLTGATFLQKRSEVQDVAFGTLRYPGGRVAHIHVSWLDPHKTRRLTLVGSSKMAVFDDASADQKLVLFDRGVEPPGSASYEQGLRIRTGEIRIPALRMQEPLRLECAAFLQSVRSRRQPLADGRSGLAVVRALEAGAGSLKAGGTFVPLAEGPG
ncbi:MAG: Gfo/Idh/MocA family oxidoreductase [Polyangiaceae bacterium]